jgi:hypothetical protein
MPVGLLLLAVLVALAFYLDRDAGNDDKVNDIDPTSNRLT